MFWGNDVAPPPSQDPPPNTHTQHHLQATGNSDEIDEIFSIFRGNVCSFDSLRVSTNFFWVPRGSCFIIPFPPFH